MRTVLIANPKGGSGKTTLATNPAGYFATRGRRVALADLDRQQSALDWLRRRPCKLPLIQGADGRKERAFFAMVGMRVDVRTRASATLDKFLQETGFPVLTCLRDAQVYALAAEQARQPVRHPPVAGGARSAALGAVAALAGGD